MSHVLYLSPYTGFRLVEDWLKGESVIKHLFRLERLKHADPEFIRNYQFNSLKRLLDQAYRHVPFYKKRFDELGILPGDIQSFEDYAQIPALTREEVQSHTEDLLSASADEKSLKKGNSSGSTGRRLNFYHDASARSAGRAAVLTGWRMAGKRLGNRLTTLWGNTIDVEEKWTRPGSRLKALIYRNARIPAYLLTNEIKVKEAFDIILKQKGGFLQSYTSSLYALALYAQSHGIQVEPKFDGVLTTAETIFPHQRKAIEEVFGPVYDGYGSNEILGMAYQCQERQGYHLMDPNIIFETADFSGEVKEIVVTDLWNFAFPFIRYRIGDLTSGELGPCPCGCTWRRIERIEGRATDAFTTPQGGIFPITASGFRELKPFFPPIQQYQLAKVAPNKIILRLQIQEDQPLDLGIIKSRMEPYYKDMFEFDVERVEKFEAGPSGKHKLIVDET